MSWGVGERSLGSTVSVLCGKMMLVWSAAMVLLDYVVFGTVSEKCSNSIEMQDSIIKSHKE